MLTALLALAAASLHPNSMSRTRIEVEGPRARVELAVQALTLIEELGLDADRDLFLDEEELAAARPALESYVLKHLSLYTEGAPEAGGVRVSGAVTALSAALDPPAGGAFPMLGQWVFIELLYTAEAPLAHLAVSFELFKAMNNAHLDYATLVWNGEKAQQFVFAADSRTWVHEPWAERRPRVLSAFMAFGARASASPATLALLVALLCAAPRGRTAGKVAFLAVLGAALGLAPGALGALGTAALPWGFAPLGAALSAAYVATDALLRGAPRRPLLEALVFGLVHGLAAGQAISADVLDEPLSGAAALGLELGYAPALLAIAAVLCALLAVLPGDRASQPEAEAWLAPRLVRAPLLFCAALVGFVLFASEAGFLDWIGTPRSGS